MRSRIFISTISVSLVAALTFPAAAQTTPPAQPPKAPEAAPQFPFEGEVSGTNVYVRSGPGVNYYPSTKLNAGDRVVVLGERFGWYQIVPPAKCFSYIDMAMVEKQPGGKTGKVVQDKVYVRAGSDLETRKTSTQVVLNKGEMVNILGEADGFYKIKPPPGASLWISKPYVETVPDRLKTGIVERHATGPKPSEMPARPPAAPTQTAGSTPVPADAGAAPPAGAVVIPPEADGMAEPTGDDDLSESDIVEEFVDEVARPAAAPPSETTPSRSASGAAPQGAGAKSEKPGEMTAPAAARWSAMLTVLESELRVAVQGQPEEQSLTALQAKYSEIATQTDDQVSAQVAQIRIRQLGELIELQGGRARIVADVQDLETFRASMDQKRQEIRSRRIAAVFQKYDLEGELRQSYAFAPEKNRYRLVDPSNQTTIAYVDIPSTVPTKPDELIGQLVGIRASSVRFNPATQVPIAVATEVVDLSPRMLPLPATNPDENSNPRNKPAETPKSTGTRVSEKAPSDRPAAGKPVTVAGDGTKQGE